MLVLFSCVAPRPTANAPDRGPAGLFAVGEASGESDPATLAGADPFTRDLYKSAESLNRDLHTKSIDTRMASEYRRVIDSYELVGRAGDAALAARALAQAADLMREMADASGDYTLYQKAIDTYNRIKTEYPSSAYVGYSLINIAQIYEENLQDLDGAISAYREVSSYFPDSVMGRETRAVLLRLESETGASNSTPDVELSGTARQNSIGPTLDNVRNFTGSGYARIVLDLSDSIRFQARKAGKNGVEVSLSGGGVSTALLKRRFIIRDREFLSRIRVMQTNAGAVSVQLQTAGPSDFSAYQLSEPERVIIDLRQADGRPTAVMAGDYPKAGSSERSDQDARKLAAKNRDWGQGSFNLPDVDVSNLEALENSVKDKIEGSESAPAAEPKASAPSALSATSQSPMRCIVIDPGHGGHDTGTIGQGGLMEKDLVLEVGRRLRDYIRKYYPQIEVVMTRDSDRFVALEERTAIANSHRADLFMSIHANAAPSHSASGVETYYLSPDRATSEEMRAAARENSTLATETAGKAAEANFDKSKDSQPIVATVSAGNRIAESRALAGYIQSGLVHGIGSADPHAAVNRGIKHAPFHVLVGAAMPAVLAEISFVSNPKDESLLRTSDFRSRIAASLFAGLRAYLKKISPSPAATATALKKAERQAAGAEQPAQASRPRTTSAIK